MVTLSLKQTKPRLLELELFAFDVGRLSIFLNNNIFMERTMSSIAGA